MLLDGSGDSVESASHADWNFGSGDFTVEAWVRPSSLAAGDAIVVARDPGTARSPFAIKRNGADARIYMSSAGTSWDIVNGVSFGTLVIDTWHHVALSRVGSSIYGSLDGVTTLVGTSSAAVWQNDQALAIGTGAAAEYWTGWVDDVRITKGVGRYTTDFTPPDVAFPNA